MTTSTSTSTIPSTTATASTTRFPAVFVNHGGGPLPLLGQQPEIVQHMKDVVNKWLPSDRKPTAIVVLSAHWESDPVKITSASKPELLYDYYGFLPQTYEYKYPAPGSPALALKIQTLLQSAGVPSELDAKRGLDHGVFVPLMVMYPDANIPVVCVSLHSSLNVDKNIAIGKALQPLRDEGILILGSGYTFHNMQGFFHPSTTTYKGANDFNRWLMDTMTNPAGNAATRTRALQNWAKAPGARISHPREEHLIPLFITAAAGGFVGNNHNDDDGQEKKEETENPALPLLVYNTGSDSNSGVNKDHAISAYLFP